MREALELLGARLRRVDASFLDGDMLDLGVVRDSILNASNNLQAFAETSEGVAMVGVESLHLTMDVCPSGEASGTVGFSCEPVGS